jgi:hypothetical protein
MQSTVHERQHKPASKSGTGASLSVVVVSSGSVTVAQQAAQMLKAASADLDAQFILVAHADDPAFAISVEQTGAEFVAAPAGSSRAEMCDLGMMRANGTIVAVRDDVAIGDASWLDVYRRVVPARVALATAPVESVVMDTLVAGRVALADAVAFSTLETRGDSSSIEMAAAV